jgi:DNA polymerase (family X)
MDNTEIGKLVEETGLLLELRDGPCTVSSVYAQLAKEILNLTSPLVVPTGNDWPKPIGELPDSLSQVLVSLMKTGTSLLLEELRVSVPPGLVELLGLPDFKPSRVRLLREKIDVESVEDLETACHQGLLAALPQFDEKSEAQILQGISFWRSNADRHHLHLAWVTANPILERLRNLPIVIRCSVTGDLRRWTETVPGISFLVSATNTGDVLEFFSTQTDVREVVERDETSVRVVMSGGLRATVRVVSDRMFPFALAKYTGSDPHYEALRTRAATRGMRLNEFGLFRSDADADDPGGRIRCQGEEELHHALGMDFIPPELRENDGEFEAAELHELPNLLDWTALRGSLHNHSDWSDGRQTLREVASHAYEMGCSYWAVTDHSHSCFAGKGIDPRLLIAQINEIEHINQLYQDAERPFRVLSGTEVDIRAGGQLDFDNEMLAQLDVVVASIHQSLHGNEAEMTKRLIRAAENPYVQIIGHVTGRMLLQREGYQVNQHAVIDACAETGTWIELNASPWRFDMDWRLWRYAKERGVKCVINTNSHRAEHGQYLRFGAQVARKGWLTKRDVVNTLPLKHLSMALLKKRIGWE